MGDSRCFHILKGTVEAARHFTCEAPPCEVIHGKMRNKVQNKGPEHLYHRILESAAEAERHFVCEACDLIDAILQNKGPAHVVLLRSRSGRTYAEGAQGGTSVGPRAPADSSVQFVHCVGKGAVEVERHFAYEDLPCNLIYAIFQDKVPAHWARSILEGAVQAERHFACEAIPCDLFYGIFLNKVGQSIVEGAVADARQLTCEALSGVLMNDIMRDKVPEHVVRSSVMGAAEAERHSEARAPARPASRSKSARSQGPRPARAADPDRWRGAAVQHSLRQGHQQHHAAQRGARPQDTTDQGQGHRPASEARPPLRGQQHQQQRGAAGPGATARSRSQSSRAWSCRAQGRCVCRGACQ